MALLLEGEAGCEKVNCKPPVGALLDADARDCWAAGKAAGWEKLKPAVAGLVLENKPVDVDVVDAAPKGELDIVVVVGSGLALMIGLKSASFDGLKLNSDDPNPLLWVTFDEVPNMLVVEVVEVGCPNTGCPKPIPELAVAAACPNCGAACCCCVPNPLAWLPNPCPNPLGCPNVAPKLGASPKTELDVAVCPNAGAPPLLRPKTEPPCCCPNAGACCGVEEEAAAA